MTKFGLKPLSPRFRRETKGYLKILKIRHYDKVPVFKMLNFSSSQSEKKNKNHGISQSFFVKTTIDKKKFLD